MSDFESEIRSFLIDFETSLDSNFCAGGKNSDLYAALGIAEQSFNSELDLSRGESFAYKRVEEWPVVVDDQLAIPNYSEGSDSSRGVVDNITTLSENHDFNISTESEKYTLQESDERINSGAEFQTVVQESSCVESTDIENKNCTAGCNLGLDFLHNRWMFYSRSTSADTTAESMPPLCCNGPASAVVYWVSPNTSRVRGNIAFDVCTLLAANLDVPLVAVVIFEL